MGSIALTPLVHEESRGFPGALSPSLEERSKPTSNLPLQHK